MITVVQLRVLRKMVEFNVSLTSSGGAFFKGHQGDVRKQTVEALEKKGLVEVIEDLNWCGAEYQITDAGRQVVGEYVSPLVRKELVLAMSIMDEKGKLNAEGNSRMLWVKEWDTVRRCLFDALELLEEGVPYGT